MNKKYKAFISYNHNDVESAIWLQTYLESKKLPAKLSKNKGLQSKNIGKVFRDGSDLSIGNDLDEVIIEALDQSEFLIVVCSNYAKKSAHVNNEVDYFKSLGNEEKILCVVVAGDFKADDSITHLPPSIQSIYNNSDRKKEPLLLILKGKLGNEKNVQADKIIAKLIGATPRELKDSYEYAKQIKRYLVIIVFSFISYFAFDYWDSNFREVTKYYRHLIKKNNIFTGLYELSFKEARKSNESFKLTYKGRTSKPIVVEKVKGGEFPLVLNSILETELTWKCSSKKGIKIRIDYDNGHKETYLSRNNVALETVFYPSNKTAELKEGDFGCERGKEGIQYIQLLEDNLGYVKTKKFLKSNRKPAKNDFGVYQYEYRNNNQGLPVEERVINYDGRFTVGNELVHLIRRELDNFGNSVKVNYFDVSGLPSLSVSRIAGYRSDYDDLGNQVRVEFFGVDDKPTLDSDGYAGYTREFDDRGNKVRVAYFGVDGKPTLSDFGYAGWTNEFDDEGNIVRVTYFGVDGKPALHDKGYAGRSREFDERGNEVRVAYFGVDGKPTLSDDGYAIRSNEFDDLNNLIRQSFFGVNGEPTFKEVHKFSTIKNEFDDEGNRVRVAYFGVDGKPTLNVDGYAGWSSEFDDRGNEIRVAYFGVDGKPAHIDFGYAGRSREFDDRGNEVRVTYFGVDGKPTLSVDGYAGWSSEYDDRGDEVRVAYFGVDGKPTLHVNGYAGWSSEFDDRSNEVRTTYFGVDGKPKLQEKGFAGWSSEYDDRGNEVRVEYFGVDGKPKLQEKGFAGWTKKFDDKGNQIRHIFLGADGKPKLQEKGFAGWTREYDDRGNLVRVAYFGVDGKPTLHRKGYAGFTRDYDNQGFMGRESYFGVEGEPKLRTAGFAFSEEEYDIHGNSISLSYKDLNKLPKEAAWGYSKRCQKFDERNNEISRVHIGEKNELVMSNFKSANLNQTDFSIRHRAYDDQGIIFEVLLDDYGKPIKLDNAYYGKTVNKSDTSRERIYTGLSKSDALMLIEKVGGISCQN